jgi:uncharacterized protein with PIN domain
VIANLRDEPEAEACARAIESSEVRCISAANFLEAALIIDASHDPIALKLELIALHFLNACRPNFDE